MKNNVIRTLDCSIAWLETIESEEPKVSPIINELAKIKVEAESSTNKNQLTLPLPLPEDSPYAYSN